MAERRREKENGRFTFYHARLQPDRLISRFDKSPIRRCCEAHGARYPAGLIIARIEWQLVSNDRLSGTY